MRVVNGKVMYAVARMHVEGGTMHIVKPILLALVAASPVVGGAISHHQPPGYDQRADLKTLCASEGSVAAKRTGSEALAVAVFAEASAVYGDQAGQSLFCRQRTVPAGSAVSPS